MTASKFYVNGNVRFGPYRLQTFGATVAIEQSTTDQIELLRARLALMEQERALIDQLLEAHARAAGAKVAGVKKDDAAGL